MVATEARELRECGDWKLLREMFLHVSGNEPPLPRSQASSSCQTFAVPHALDGVHEFVREHDSERITIASAANALTFHERLDFEHCLPQDRVMEMNSRYENLGIDVSVCSQCHGGWMNIDVGDVGRSFRTVPFAKPTTRRHEGKGSGQVLPRRVRQTLDGRYATVARQILVRDKQMQWTTIPAVEMFVVRKGDRFRHHAGRDHSVPAALRWPDEPDPVFDVALRAAIH